MSEWYEGLTGDELFGKHVHVKFSNSVEAMGPVLTSPTSVALDLCGEHREILSRPAPECVWHLVPSAISVEEMWDERDWEPLNLNELTVDDSVVVGGKVYQVCGWDKHGETLRQLTIDLKHVSGVSLTVSVDMVGDILRRKPVTLPGPGYYKDSLGRDWAQADDGENYLATPSCLKYYPPDDPELVASAPFRHHD